MATKEPLVQSRWRRLEINGGRVHTEKEISDWRLTLPPVRQGYANAQIDDYGQPGGPHFRWQPGTSLSLQARFSHSREALAGTAGFGFWNAPFGPGTGPWPRLPQAAWFFYAAEPGDLPLAPVDRPGRGWFAATIDAGSPRALAWAPLAPPVLLLNQFSALRRRLWPLVRRSLGISFAPVNADMTAWQQYELVWRKEACFFRVGGRPVLQIPFAPRGPLGFVCWIDNQYLVATIRGRLGWGTVHYDEEQWLRIRQLQVRSSH